MKGKKTGGRKPFEPTPANRLMVTKLAALGWSHEQIAECLGVSDVTMRKYMADDLLRGNMQLVADIEATLLEIATDKEHKACVPAATLLLKAKGGNEYRETKRTEITGADGGPLQQQIQQIDAIDSSKLSMEERDALAKILETATDISEEQAAEFESEEDDAEE